MEFIIPVFIRANQFPFLPFAKINDDYSLARLFASVGVVTFSNYEYHLFTDLSKLDSSMLMISRLWLTNLKNRKEKRAWLA